MFKPLLKTSLGAAAAVALFAAPAQAAVFGTLTFDTPNGVVFGNQDIAVWLTLTLDANSDALITDASGITNSLSDAEIGSVISNSHGDFFDPNLTSDVIVNNSFECSGTFVNGCDPGAYQFDFNYNSPSFIGAQNLNLHPGSSSNWLFGTFRPVGGNAAPGVYTFYNANFIFQFSQPNLNPDEENPGDTLYGSVNIASTCQFQNDACAFTRTVLAAPGGAVPEPASWALMIVGFGGVGALLRRRGGLTAFG